MCQAPRISCSSLPTTSNMEREVNAKKVAKTRIICQLAGIFRIANIYCEFKAINYTLLQSGGKSVRGSGIMLVRGAAARTLAMDF
jgi:hypothetical protein